MTSFTSLMYVNVLFLLVEYLKVTAPVQTNIAQGKPAYQSSVAHNGHPFYAVDGVTGGNFHRDRCMHTPYGKSWWMVDLLNVYNISTITIFKRTDSWSGQLDLLKIEGFLGHPTLCPASSPKVCVNQMGSFTGTYKTVACEQEVMARYVNVSADDTMMMCEVQVFGEGICYKNDVQIQKGRKQDSPSPMQSSLASSRMECSNICYRHSCTFFNYNRVTGECQTGSGLATSASFYATADWDLGTIC
ncbi:fucolectin-4-like [Haliotis rubra]|uniref:fucolectin-4-like n=1 Tax=Haliotis rubra TaxID=36100 RepID=UPI001EE5999B|nr:fucolectin-4-like [Haliotis rubra]